MNSDQISVIIILLLFPSPELYLLMLLSSNNQIWREYYTDMENFLDLHSFTIKGVLCVVGITAAVKLSCFFHIIYA
jgi:hypothetical protein